MKTIFLAGIHGVGKSYIGKSLERIINLKHLTASELIKSEKGKSTWNTNKYAGDLDDNQITLIRALQKAHHNIDQHILLDGHFALLNTTGELTTLDASVFKKLDLSSVILLTQDTNVVAERLKARDKSTVDIALIKNLANAELQQAINVCDEIGLPLNILHAPTLQTVRELVISIIE